MSRAVSYRFTPLNGLVKLNDEVASAGRVATTVNTAAAIAKIAVTAMDGRRTLALM
jgi:hypothetical protein